MTSPGFKGVGILVITLLLTILSAFLLFTLATFSISLPPLSLFTFTLNDIVAGLPLYSSPSFASGLFTIIPFSTNKGLCPLTSLTALPFNIVDDGT